MAPWRGVCQLLLEGKDVTVLSRPFLVARAKQNQNLIWGTASGRRLKALATPGTCHYEAKGRGLIPPPPPSEFGCPGLVSCASIPLFHCTPAHLSPGYSESGGPWPRGPRRTLPSPVQGRQNRLVVF